MTVTVKLDVTLEAQLRLRASLSGRSTSDVIRAALAAYLARAADDDAAAVRSAHALGADLFGRHAGPADLATSRKREIAALWSDKPKPAPPLKKRSAAAAALQLREPAPAYGRHIGPVLADSGPLIALFNGADHWHARVVDWLRSNPAATLVATWPVATEVCALLARRIGNDAALDFLRWSQRGGITLDGAAEGSVTEVLRISERFAELPFDLADASVAEAAARLRISAVLSIDADFDVYRDRGGKPLRNVLRG